MQFTFNNYKYDQAVGWKHLYINRFFREFQFCSLFKNIIVGIRPKKQTSFRILIKFAFFSPNGLKQITTSGEVWASHIKSATYTVFDIVLSLLNDRHFAKLGGDYTKVIFILYIFTFKKIVVNKIWIILIFKVCYGEYLESLIYAI